MKICEKCKVEVRTEKNSCPLCGYSLEAAENKAATDVFPEIPTLYQRYNLFFRILFFVTAVVVITAIVVNLIIIETGMWFLFVVLGAVTLWISLVTIIKKKNNLQKNIIYHVLIVSVVSLVWDKALGWHGWSIEYVIPCICIVAMLLFAILYRILDMPISTYFMYFVVDAVFGIIPIIFYATDSLDVYIPSLVCVAVSLISVLALITFWGKEMLAEMKRRFHL